MTVVRELGEHVIIDSNYIICFLLFLRYYFTCTSVVFSILMICYLYFTHVQITCTCCRPALHVQYMTPFWHFKQTKFNHVMCSTDTVNKSLF